MEQNGVQIEIDTGKEGKKTVRNIKQESKEKDSTQKREHLVRSRYYLVRRFTGSHLLNTKDMIRVSMKNKHGYGVCWMYVDGPRVERTAK